MLKISREFICCAGCCWCAGCCKTCGFLVTISSPSTGEIFGHVKQGWISFKKIEHLNSDLNYDIRIFIFKRQSCWKPKLFVLDANMERVLQIDGPTCIINGPCCPCENEFKVNIFYTKFYGRFTVKIVKNWWMTSFFNRMTV